MVAYLRHHEKLRKDDDQTADDLPLSDLAAIGLISAPLTLVAEDGGQSFLASIDLSDDLFGQVHERAVRYVRDHGAELVTDIDESTRNMLAGTIADSLAANEGITALTDRIASDYAFSDDRAQLIAETEVANANQAGALEGMKAARDAGVKLKKIWLPDAEACDICLDNGDAGPIDLDDTFPSGDDAPQAHPNCRCVLASEVDDDSH